MATDTLYTTKQIADALGITTGRVRQLARDLNLGRWVGTVRLFDDADLERLRARNQTRGRKDTRA
jgi:hypothetical protein